MKGRSHFKIYFFLLPGPGVPGLASVSGHQPMKYLQLHLVHGHFNTLRTYV